jgi:hypothetical protein
MQEAARLAQSMVQRAATVQDVSGASGQRGAMFERLNHTAFRRLGFVTEGQADLGAFMGVVHGAASPAGRWFPSAGVLGDVETHVQALLACFVDSVNNRLGTSSNFSLLRRICHVGPGSMRQAYSTLTEGTAANYASTVGRCLLFLLRREQYETLIRPAVLEQQGQGQQHQQQQRGPAEPVAAPWGWDAAAFVADADAAFERLGPLPEEIVTPLTALYDLLSTATLLPARWDSTQAETAEGLRRLHALLLGIIDRVLPLSYAQQHEPLFHFLMATNWSEEEGFLDPTMVNINGSHLKWALRGAVWFANAPEPWPPHTASPPEMMKLLELVGYADPPDAPPGTRPFREMADFCNFAASLAKSMAVVPRVMLASATDPTRSLVKAGRDFTVTVDFDAIKLGIQRAMREGALPRLANLLDGAFGCVVCFCVRACVPVIHHHPTPT